MTVKSRIRVLHLVPSLDIGGAENDLILKTVQLANRVQFAVVALKRKGVWAGRLENIGIPVAEAKMRGPADITGVARVLRAIGGFRPDIVHAHMFHAHLVAHVVRLLRRASKVIYTIQKEASRASSLEILVDRILSKGTTGIVASSGAVLQSYANRGLSAERGSVVHNCIDVHSLKAGQNLLREQYGVKSDFIIGTVGRLIPEKGYEFLLGALPEIARHGPSICCVFLGDGPEKVRLQEQARRLDVYRSTLWLGSRPDIQNFTPFLDVFVLPSLTEAFGIAAAEASWFGVPIVCTNVGGLPEVVIDRLSGFHVRPRDASAIANKVISLIDDASLRTTMGAAGRRAARRFSAERLAAGWMQIYEKAIPC